MATPPTGPPTGLPPGPDPPVGGFEAPHPNGAHRGSSRQGAHRLRTRILAAVGVLVAIAWGWALWYSLTRADPEPLDDDSLGVVEEACVDAARTLAALNRVDPPSEVPTARADHVDDENGVLAAMVDEMGRADPPDASGAEALHDWRADWDAVIAARGRYADDLGTGVEAPRLALPVDGGGTKPVTVRMDQYATTHGLEVCRSEALQVEVVEGERVYGEE